MENRIDNLVDVVTALLAVRLDQPVARMRPLVRRWLQMLARHYLLAGAPYGQSEDAFLVWLDERRVMSRSA